MTKKTIKTPTIVFDIDGTLADIEHRLPYIEKDRAKRDWKSFNALCPHDEPIQPIIDVCNEFFKKGKFIVLCTAREESMRKGTVEWLDKHGVNYHSLMMRPLKNFKDDTLIKGDMVDILLKNNCEIELVYDDRPKVIRMFEARNLPVVDCGNGIEF